MVQKKYSAAAILLLLNFICAGSFNLSDAGAATASSSKLNQARPEQHTPRYSSRQVVDLHAASKKTFELKRSNSEFAERKPKNWVRYFACHNRKTPAQAAKKGEKHARQAGSCALDTKVSTATKVKPSPA